MTARDTHPDAHDVQVRCYQRMAPSARVALALELSEQTRRIAMSGIRQRHPDYSEREVWFALQRLLLGDPLFHQAWPRAPRLEP
ncbi:MAG: hypothetical protein ACTHU0_13100 [Kofleriaceae bacterium]